MYGFFKFVMYFGVVMGLAGFALGFPQFQESPFVASLPQPITKNILSFGGLGLIVLGLLGRSATRPEL